MAKSEGSKLFKVALDDPSNSKEVVVEGMPSGADGLELIDAKTIVVVCNAGNAVVTLESEDGWESSKIVKTFTTPEVFPTTATKRGEDAYVLYAGLNKLFGGDTTETNFPIQKID